MLRRPGWVGEAVPAAQWPWEMQGMGLGHRTLSDFSLLLSEDSSMPRPHIHKLTHQA